jgi:hypothetical protein
VVACKAPEWCGHHIDDGDEKQQAWMKDDRYPPGAAFRSEDGMYRYCSPSCYDAKHPPLAAQPAEAKRERLHAPHYYCADCGYDHPAEQPKPAAKDHDFSDPYCARRYEGAVVRLCVACGAFDKDGMRSPGCELIDGWRKDFEGWVGETAQTGTPYTGPERIVKPPMAHSMGIEDPTLPEAR